MAPRRENNPIISPFIRLIYKIAKPFGNFFKGSHYRLFPFISSSFSLVNVLTFAIFLLLILLKVFRRSGYLALISVIKVNKYSLIEAAE